jgi:hypothetical protein
MQPLSGTFAPWLIRHHQVNESKINMISARGT